MKIDLIVNLRAGKTKKLLRDVELALKKISKELKILPTEKPRHGITLAKLALKEGTSIIGVFGGDGTINEVVNGIMMVKEEIPHLELPPLLILPAGTGGDFRKSLDLPPNPLSIIPKLLDPQIKKIDIGKITFHTITGKEEKAYFINIVSFGMSGMVDHLVNCGKLKRIIGGKIAFYFATLNSFLYYKGDWVTLEIDGEKYKEKINTVAICNGKFFGGGMQVAPLAKLDDNLFDVVIIRDLSLIKFLLNGWKIYTGKHITEEKIVIYKKAKIIKASPVVNRGPIWLDVDGETPGTLPLEVTILPKAIKVIA